LDLGERLQISLQFKEIGVDLADDALSEGGPLNSRFRFPSDFSQQRPRAFDCAHATAPRATAPRSAAGCGARQTAVIPSATSGHVCDKNRMPTHRTGTVAHRQPNYRRISGIIL